MDYQRVKSIINLKLTQRIKYDAKWGTHSPYFIFYPQMGWMQPQEGTL